MAHRLAATGVRSVFRYASVIAFLVLSWPCELQASLDQTGHWVPALSEQQWSWYGNDGANYAVHMVLLRGDANYHSHVIFWGGDNTTTFLGDEWGWNPTQDGCSTSLESNFASLGMPSSGFNLFCSGHVPVASTGELLVSGGASQVTMEYGNDDSRLLQDRLGSTAPLWSNSSTPGHMSTWRWYPSEVALGGPGGRVLVLSGDQHHHHRFFGGRKNGAIPSGGDENLMYRFSPVAGGQWEQNVTPAPDPTYGSPDWREDHSVAQMEDLGPINGHVIFGGKGADGNPLPDLWYLKRGPNVTGADYGYYWEKRANATGQAPTARSGHSAVTAPPGIGGSGMYIFGGRNGNGTAIDNVVYRLSQAGNGNWLPFLAGGSVPSSRFGHTSIVDEFTLNGGPTNTDRMIVYGGVSADNQPPNDNSVYQLQFAQGAPSSGTWSQMARVQLATPDDVPAPRWGHAMAWDSERLLNTVANQYGHIAYMYGGRLANGSYSSELWKLWLFEDGTSYGWERMTPAGTGPGPRARHSLILDSEQGDNPGLGEPGGRIYIFGGENGSGPTDGIVYKVDVRATTPSWAQWADLGANLTGMSFMLDHDGVLARVPEVYDPSTRHWQAPLTTATLLQYTYPPTFVVSGGAVTGDRVVSLATDQYMYYLDVATAASGNTWHRFEGSPGATNGYFGFKPESGVLYGPNKIMLAGGLGPGTSTAVVGTTKTLDAGSLANAWATSGTNLTPRVYTNLVLLPNGKVLAVGGNGTGSQDNDSPVKQPQIWDPAGNSGQGIWTDPALLDQQPTVRGYHSSAVLLPDGRVLSSGGEHTTDKYLANIFCPPYLFSGDSPAVRPVLLSVPDTINYSDQYLIETDSPISRVTMLRPGAATHAYDQNQRFYEATIVSSCQNRYLIVPPADASIMPAGNLLLFVLNASGTPSVAKWVHLRAGALVTSVAPCPHSGGGGGCPFVDTDGDSGWVVENSILGRSLAQQSLLDDYRLSHEPVLRDGRYRLRIRENEQEQTTLDQVRLVAVDHRPEVRAFASGENVVLGIPHPALQVTTSTGADITALVSGLGPSYFVGQPGETLLVRLAGGTHVARASIASGLDGGGFLMSGGYKDCDGTVDCYGLRPAFLAPPTRPIKTDAAVLGGTGLLIQIPDVAGSWRTVTHAYPREDFSPAYFDSVIGDQVRIVFVGRHKLQFLGSVELAPDSVVAHKLELMAARHSRLGDVMSAVTSLGNLSTSLQTGDTLSLEFDALAVPEGQTRELFLLSNGVYTSNLPAHLLPDEVPVPEFNLDQNRPNPFSRMTTISFRLLKAGPARLEVFDLMGRRIRTLVSGPYAAGAVSIDWDRRDGQGNPVQPGIYLYRLTAGPHRAERRLVVLP